MNPMFRMWRCYFSGLLDAGRWRMFLHSRMWLRPPRAAGFPSGTMWLGLPVAAVAAFVVIFLLRRFGEGLPTAEAFWKGAVYALVIAFCWALGVWAAVGPEPSDDDGRQDGEAVGNVGSRAAWRGRVLCFVLLLGAFALVCSSQISEMLGGECSLARGFGGILLKAMAVAAVVVPVWLDSRRSKW